MNHHSLLTLLLIDDCAEDRVIFRHFLQHDSLYTYRIVEFETVTEGIEWCQQEIPDVILLDYSLPDADGLEFLELVRGELGNDQSAVIMLTGQGDEIIAVRAMKRGAQEYLIKNTLTPEILQGAIRHAVEEMHLIKQLQQSQDQQQLMASIALRIRQSLQLQEILTATAYEVRQFLQADRVVVYQFHPDMSGTVVAESVLPGWRVSLGIEIQDTCFQQGAGADYHLGKKQAIDNIYQAGLTDCHLQLLEEFEVKANLVVPILVNNQLWGLLIAHQCGAPRHWQTVELDLLDQLGVQIAIAIQQASAYEQLQAELAERQRVQESLQESEERFRCTFEQAAVGISHVSLHGQFLRLNQRFCEIAGYPQAELQRLTFPEITHPDDLAADLELMQQLLAGEIDTYSIEKRYRRKDGEYVWINLTVSLVRDRSGEAKYFISVIQDITDRKQMEAALLQKKQRLNMALEAAAMGTWDWNIQTGEIIWSPSLEILFGFTPGSFNGRYETVVAMMHPDDRESVLQAINRAVYERQEYNIEFRFIKPDGTVRWALSKGRVFYDQKGQPIQMMGVDLDITERKQADAALKESEARFQAFMNNSPSVAWISDENGRVVYLNQAYCRILAIGGQTLEDVINKTPFEIYPDVIAQPILDNIRQVAQTQQTLETIEQAPRRDGTMGNFLVYKFPLPSNSGQCLVGGVAVDITERIHAQQALQQLNQELEARVEQRTQALRESEERWQLALRGSNDGIWDWNVKTNEVFYSTRWKEMRGFAEDEISSSLEECTSRIHPDDCERVTQTINDHFAQKTPFFQAEYRVQRKDGVYIWVLDRGQALWDEAGNVIRMTGSETDITRRKQAEAELLALSSLQQAILEGTDYAIISTRPDGIIQTFNAAAVKMLGYTAEEVVGQVTPLIFYDLEELQQQAQALSKELGREITLGQEFAEAKIQQGNSDEEFTFIRKDGSRFPVSLSVKPLYGQDGHMIGGVGIAKDITQQKQIETQLRKNAASLTAAQRIANLGSWEFDLQTQEIIWSEEIFRIFGRDLAAGTPTYAELSQLIHPYDHDLHDVAVQQASQHGTSYEIECRFYRPDESLGYFLARGEVIFNVDGKPIQLIGTVQDITNRKQAEEQLRKLSARLTLALKAGAIGAWDWDIIQEAQWDDRMYELYDMQRSDSLPLYQRWVNALHPEDRVATEAAFEAAVRGEKEFATEFRIIHQDGSIHFIKAAAIVQRNDQGEPLRMVGINYDITERKQIEAALQESKRRYATLTEAAPVAIFRFDSAGNCVYVNDYWSKMTGRPTQAALGMGWVETLHPEDSDRLLQEWMQEWMQGGFYQNEGRCLRPDGTIVWFVCQALPETDADGTIIGYVGTLTDITERKQVESALRESEHRYATLTAAAPVAIFRFDNAGNCIYVNDYWSKMTGRPTQAALGKGWIETLHPDDRDYILADVERRYQQDTDNAKQEFQNEGRHVRPDGSINYFYCQVLAESDPSGQIIGHIGTLTDITERKLAEEARAKYAREVEDLYDHAPCGYHSLDPEGRIVKVNETELQWLGYTHEEAIGTYLTHFVTPASRSVFDEKYSQFKECGWLKDLELDMICKDGTIFPVLVSATAVKSADGTYLYSRSTLFDIRDRKQTEAQLRQTNEQLCQTNAQLARVTRLKDEFLANMSHELRTPLNAILGMSEGLKEGVFGEINERQKKAISTIERSGKHLLELINDILDLSKIESGKVELQLSEVSVRGICDVSLAFVRQMALKKNIRLTTRISEHLGSILADERRLRQVLINLLSNAIKFTPEAGSVFLEVCLETPENPINPTITPFPHLTLSVTDTGIGISAEDLKKLFQPFVQVDSSLNRQYEGTGLGLALVQRIVALHQGTVAVSSEPGKGSCFTVRIPYPTSDNFPKIEQTLPLPSHCLPKENAQVLIIEDSTPASEQITRYLLEMGMQPIVYPRGEGAAKEVERLLPALVILDLQLPNLSGWEILHQIKTNPHTQQIPVLIISVIDERTTGLAQGAFEYLVKPISRNELQTVIKKLQSPHCDDFAQEIVLPKPQEKSPLILLAEDNQANIDTMSGYLECRGYRLVLANNGQQAIDIALAQRPDLIVMDIQMPVMDGLEAIRCIRQDQQFSNVPIIALTALAMPGDRETCLCAGANEYLSKPIKLKQLVATIQQLLQRYQRL